MPICFPGSSSSILKAALLAALTLFISTFATSNIFTIVVMVFIYFIGHLQSTAREYWLQEHGGGWLVKAFLAFVALIFPISSSLILSMTSLPGTAIPMALFAKTAVLGMRLHVGLPLLRLGRRFTGKEL